MKTYIANQYIVLLASNLKAARNKFVWLYGNEPKTLIQAFKG